MNVKTAEVMLSVVIVNFRTSKFVIDCLSSLLPELNGIDSRVVIVDNFSQDASPGKIKTWLAENNSSCSNVVFIQSGTNGGFSAGNNIGIQSQKAKYYLLLNSDTLVRPGSIQTMIDEIQCRSEVGIVSPRLEWSDGGGQNSCFKFHSSVSEFMAAAQTGFIDRFLKRYIVAMPVQSKLASPEWTSFACVLIQGEVFQQVGLLDDGYFMYFEDAEFCFRARKVGWVIMHTPLAKVVHFHGESSSVKNRTLQKKRLPRYCYESRARFFYQTGGRIGLLLANIMWLLGRGVSGVRQIFGRADKNAIEGQWLDIWTNFLTPLKKYTHPNFLRNK